MLETLGVIIALAGLLIVVAGSIWFIATAFSESLLWGLGVLFLGPVHLIFLILHWDAAKKPFFLQLKGLLVLFIGALLANRLHG